MKARGFTLVELLTVLAVLALLLSVGLPDLAAMVAHQQLRASVFDLLSAVNHTRSEAISRGMPVLLVPNDPAGVNWAAGWTVLVDRDGDRRPGAGDTIIAVHGPLQKGIRVSTRFSHPQQPDYIAYNGSGRGCTDTSGLAARWGSLMLFQGDQERHISINMLGRARVCDPAREPASCSQGR